MKLAYLYGIESSNPYLSTYSHYPVTKKISFVDEIKNDKPLLIVGIKKAKELYPNQIDLNENHIEKNIYWCYSPEEYLSEFLKKYEEFILNIHDSYLNLLEFKIIDIFFSNLTKENELIEYLSDKNINTYYHVGKTMYCYSNVDNIIYIINLNEFYWFRLINLVDFGNFLNGKKYYNDFDQKILNYFIRLFHGQDKFFIEKTIAYFIFLNETK
jgi:hypothetical protein